MEAGAAQAMEAADHPVDMEEEVREVGEGLAAAAREGAAPGVGVLVVAAVLESSQFNHGLPALLRRGRYATFMQDALLNVDGTNQLPHGRQFSHVEKSDNDASDPAGKDCEGHSNVTSQATT